MDFTYRIDVDSDNHTSIEPVTAALNDQCFKCAGTRIRAARDEVAHR